MNKNFEKLVTTMSVFTDTLTPLTESPFKVVDDKAMRDLTESIKKFGILEPITVRKPDDTKSGKFEIISGYRRWEACKNLGITSVSVRVLDLSKDDAIIAMIDANLCHREQILPSEKAAAYKMKLDAMKRQGYRSDLETEGTSTTLLQKSETSIQKLANESEDNRETIRQYIRLTNLEKPLLDLVDSGRMAFRPAVELSYLLPAEQQMVLETYETDEITPSLSQAQRIRKLSEQGSLDTDNLFEIMTEPKANQKPTIKFSVERLQTVAPKVKESDLENFVMKACEHYYRYLQRQRDRDAR